MFVVGVEKNLCCSKNCHKNVHNGHGRRPARGAAGTGIVPDRQPRGHAVPRIRARLAAHCVLCHRPVARVCAHHIQDTSGKPQRRRHGAAATYTCKNRAHHRRGNYNHTLGQHSEPRHALRAPAPAAQPVVLCELCTADTNAVPPHLVVVALQ